MKKLVMIFMILALVVTGCTSKQDSQEIDKAKDTSTKVTEGSKDTDKKDTGKKAEIRYAYWGDGTEGFINNIVARFEEKNPNIKIIIEALPWSEYWTKLEASAIGGTMPDVHIQHTKYIQQYIENDLIIPITDVPGIDLSKFPEPTKAPFLFEGVAYAVPKDFDTIGLFYNKEIFDKAGVAYPDGTWDWDKLAEVAKQLTDKDNDIYGFGAYISPQQGYYNTVVQAGGNIITEDGQSGFNLDETQAGMTFWTDMIYKHKVSPTPEQFADTDAKQMFSSGKLAMMFAGSWTMNGFMMNEDIKDKFDVAPLPEGPVRKATMTNSIAFSISSNSKNIEAAKTFVEFLGSEEAQIIEAKAGGAIPAYDGVAATWLETYKNYNAQVFIDSLEFAVPLPRTKSTNKWYPEIKDYARLMITNQVSIEEGCNKLYEVMSEIISEEE